MKRLILASMLCCTQLAFSQLRVSGQASAGFVKANDGSSQYSFNAGRGSFVWRWDLFADASVSDNLTFLSNFRMLQDQIPHIDLFAIRISDIGGSGVSLQAGQIDIPFGNLAERRFPRENPFLDLPLMNEHITSLCKSDYKLWSLIPEYQIKGDGVCLLDQGLYDLGVKAYGNVGVFDYFVALINGMISTTGTYSPGGLNSNHGYGKVMRLSMTPMSGVTIGGSYAVGPFMNDESETIIISDGIPDTSAFYGRSPDAYLQKIFGGDLNVSFGHFSFEGEVVSNTWQYLDAMDLKATSYSAMVQYIFTPRISGAVRVGGIIFNEVHDAKELNEFFRPVAYSGKWDHDVFRLEGAAAYKIDKALLLKFGYQINRTYNLPRDPVDNILFAQTVLSF
jgi:hypothetical protein